MGPVTVTNIRRPSAVNYRKLIEPVDLEIQGRSCIISRLRMTWVIRWLTIDHEPWRRPVTEINTKMKFVLLSAGGTADVLTLTLAPPGDKWTRPTARTWQRLLHVDPYTKKILSRSRHQWAAHQQRQFTLFHLWPDSHLFIVLDQQYKVLWRNFVTKRLTG